MNIMKAKAKSLIQPMLGNKILTKILSDTMVININNITK